MSRTIYLNPGHDKRTNQGYMYDSGATGYGMTEAETVWEISLSVKQYLEQSGYIVYIRQSDNLYNNSKYPELNSEPSVIDEANNLNTDIFVSIHCNAYNGIALGTECLYYPSSTKSAQLAQSIQNQIVSTLGTVDRGIKERGGLLVLKYTSMPAVLVETAFIDNYTDNQLLKTRKDDFAKCIVQGIITYMNNTHSTNSPLELNVTTEKEPEITELNKLTNTVYPKTSGYKIMDVQNLALYVAKTLTETGVEGAFDSVTKSVQYDLPSIGCSQWLGQRANDILMQLPEGGKFAKRSYTDLVNSGDIQELKQILATPKSQYVQYQQLLKDCESYVRELQQIPGFDDTRCMIYAASWCTTSPKTVKLFIENISQSINFHSMNALASEFAAKYVDAFLVPLNINPDKYRLGYSNRSWNIFYYVAAINLTTDYGIPEYGKGIYGK